MSERANTITIFLCFLLALTGLQPTPAFAQEIDPQEIDKQEVEQLSEWKRQLEKFQGRRLSDLTQAERDEFASIMQRAYDRHPKDSAIQNQYADFLIGSGQYSKALEILRELSKDNALRGLQAAAVARRLGQHQEAKAIAERSLESMGKKSLLEPKKLSVSLAISQNQIFLKRYADATETLEKAIRLAETKQEQQLASHAIGDSIVAHVGAIQKKSKKTEAEQRRILELLEKAVKVSPQNPRVLTVISNALSSGSLGDDKETAELRRRLEEVLKREVEELKPRSGILLAPDA